MFHEFSANIVPDSRLQHDDLVAVVVHDLLVDDRVVVHLVVAGLGLALLDHTVQPLDLCVVAEALLVLLGEGGEHLILLPPQPLDLGFQ